jgi:hypothetical protein
VLSGPRAVNTIINLQDHLAFLRLQSFERTP